MLQKLDAKDFIMAMLKETDVHKERNRWMLMKRSDVPTEKQVNDKAKIILSFWSFKCKQFPSGTQQAHSSVVCPWWDAAMGCRLLGDIQPVSQLDNC
eukprot:8417300-Ditylum_brightwellii.AAC.1